MTNEEIEAFRSLPDEQKTEAFTFRVNELEKEVTRLRLELEVYRGAADAPPPPGKRDGSP